MWTLCLGQVSITKVNNGEDLKPRLVIFTTFPAPPETSWTREGRMVIKKRGLLESISENRCTPVTAEGLPGPNTGVFWRYNFLSDYLIVGVLVMLLLFIPPIILCSYSSFLLSYLAHPLFNLSNLLKV
ncbi:hypothetical protein PSTT_16164 [Puccinia striiformis]|uniref:Uncharacterized protein n=1 Tax=Puccinia striiformis TaxID=27350 RepID=A0A2S4UE81_9BASI|nr:hypothetical protein PSTT_16164 [Puccinia striiformis]